MFSALLCVAGSSKTELNKNILAGLCATLSPNVYDRALMLQKCNLSEYGNSIRDQITHRPVGRLGDFDLVVVNRGWGYIGDVGS